MTIARRALLVAALAMIVWATLVSVTGGVVWTLAGIRISTRSAGRPVVLAMFLFAVHVLAFGWRTLDADLAWLFGVLRTAMPALAAAASIGVLLIGLSFDTRSAGGSDPYGYVSEADLWLRHELRTAQPFVEQLPIPYANRAFAPLAYRDAGAEHEHVIVPTYPPGLPLLMALGKLMAGASGVYGVVPILGAFLIWFCYLLGARVASPVVGAGAAIVLAASPVFLFQLMWPMSDVPAAACWTAAMFFTLGASRYSAAAAGVCCAAAIAIRPNLAPLAMLPFAYLVWTRSGWLAFALGVLPGVLLVAAVNMRLYGSPFASGYGDLDALYSWANAAVNVRHYGAWLLETQTPLVAMAIIALARPPRLVNALLGAFAIAVFLAYVFYAPFDAWWYLRFLLPGLPMLLILMIGGIAWLLGRTPRLLTSVVVACGAVLLLNHQMAYAASHDAFHLREAERRYEIVGAYVAASTPSSAVVICMQHSGSLRYYGHRLTLRYDWMPPESLDGTLALLRARGYQPLIVLEDWEEPLFKQRFAASAVGRLAWKPVVEFAGRVPVSLYEPPAPR